MNFKFLKYIFPSKPIFCKFLVIRFPNFLGSTIWFALRQEKRDNQKRDPNIQMSRRWLSQWAISFKGPSDHLVICSGHLGYLSKSYKTWSFWGIQFNQKFQILSCLVIFRHSLNTSHNTLHIWKMAITLHYNDST